MNETALSVFYMATGVIGLGFGISILGPKQWQRAIAIILFSTIVAFDAYRWITVSDAIGDIVRPRVLDTFDWWGVISAFVAVQIMRNKHLPSPARFGLGCVAIASYFAATCMYWLAGSPGDKVRAYTDRALELLVSAAPRRSIYVSAGVATAAFLVVAAAGVALQIFERKSAPLVNESESGRLDSVRRMAESTSWCLLLVLLVICLLTYLF